MRAARRRNRRQRFGFTVVSVALAVAGTTFYFLGSRGSAGADIVAKDVTTTTLSRELPQVGWTVVGTGTRGVFSDKRQIVVGGITFLAARFRAATTKISWHPGSEDPPNAAKSLPGLSNKIAFNGAEGLDGVLGAFNGAFKLVSKGGGLKVGEKVLAPFKPGFATFGIDSQGNVAIWTGAAYEQPAGFNGVVFRQNLPLLVAAGQVTPIAKNPSTSIWGDTVGGTPRQSRTGVGLDATGNVVYVATMGKCLPGELAQAMVMAGLVKAMELDINPYWPILGMSPTPIFKPVGGFSTILPGSEHSPHVYIDGWTRDFFVVTARR